MLGHKVVGGLSWGLNGKESTFNAGNVGSILGRKDPLEKKMATHPSILAWEIPWTGEPGGLQSMGVTRVGRDLATDHHHQGSCCFHLLRNLHAVLHSGCISFHFHQQCKRVPFFHTLSSINLFIDFLMICFCWIIFDSEWCEMMPHCSFVLSFSNN